MNIASIDIGSNTVLLLIAETNYNKISKSLLNVYRMPRISKGLTKENNISDDKIEELIQVLDEYSELIKKYSCGKVIITATAGFRKAANSYKISQIVREKFGFEIETVDGKKEALYSFLGASSDIITDRQRLVIDIGGGSTELIYGSDNGIKYSHSFPFGAVNLTEKHIKKFPIDNKSYSDLSEHILDIFSEIKDNIPNSIYSIAVAGTPTTLTSINQNLTSYDERLVENSILTIQNISNIISELKPLTPTEIIKKYGEIVKGRNDVILTGSQILKSIMDILQIDKIVCSGKGIRYGAINYYLNS